MNRQQQKLIDGILTAIQSLDRQVGKYVHYQKYDKNADPFGNVDPNQLVALDIVAVVEARMSREEITRDERYLEEGGVLAWRTMSQFLDEAVREFDRRKKAIRKRLR